MVFIKKDLLMFFLAIFLVSFLSRGVLIQKTPGGNGFIDLGIYIDSGQLVSNNVNPYDWRDNPELRGRFRNDALAYNEYTCKSQRTWNFYASGNLPLNLIFFGLIDGIMGPVPGAYRMTFAFFDSILVALIAWYIFRWWHHGSGGTISGTNFFPIMLFTLSPLLFLWGCIYPEDKGIETLLIIGAILASKSGGYFVKFYLSACLLGLSVAFKGLGVFIIPLCAYNVFGRPGDLNILLSGKAARRLLGYLTLTAIFALIWHLPYTPHVFDMMASRMSQNVYAAVPKYGSMWRIVHWLTPLHYWAVKNVFIAAFATASVYGILTRKLGPEIFTANILLVFTAALLVQGSMDREQIAIISAILLYGSENRRVGMVLMYIYVVLGAYSFLSVFSIMPGLSAFLPAAASATAAVFEKSLFTDATFIVEKCDSVMAFIFVFACFFITLGSVLRQRRGTQA
ncbi:MAG: hypothetical protein HQL30_02560 [Candidatus Omnitrophica bacterium]|nr:hypothetical protein [Candidatus Omnitrophota bacterium]